MTRAPGPGGRLLAAALLCGGLLGAAASLVLLLVVGSPWIKPFFYIPAWVSTLLAVEGANKLLSGRSRLLDSPGRYGLLCAVSAPWWLLFEVLNLRLANWAYEGLPEPLWARWPGYGLAFATVLPAVLGFADLIEAAMRPPDAASPQDPGPVPALSSRARGLCAAAGVLMLALPMAWPETFFPLVWGFAFLLLEPRLAAGSPERSWLALWRQGRPGRANALILSGFVCGLLWEFFNYWSGAKWKYTVPWPREPKLFEMPWLGFLGFPPFALECESFWETFSLGWDRLGRAGRLAAAAGLAFFSLAAFHAMDRWTVRSTAPLPFTGRSP